MKYSLGGTEVDMLYVGLFGFRALPIVYTRNLRAGKHVGQECTCFPKMCDPPQNPRHLKQVQARPHKIQSPRPPAARNLCITDVLLRDF
jgi:hypothetical protein